MENESTTEVEGVPAIPSRRPHRRGHVAGWVALLAVPLVVGLAIAQLARTGRSPSNLNKALGFTIGYSRAGSERLSKPAPSLEGEALDGGTLDLAAYRGQVVVINLWASWCGPCRAEQPELERLWGEYRSRGVQFLGINIRDTRIDAKVFREEFHVTYPSFYDPSAALTHRLRVRVLPTTFIIDRDGRIVLRFSGRIDRPLLKGALDQILSPGAGA